MQHEWLRRGLGYSVTPGGYEGADEEGGRCQSDAEGIAVRVVQAASKWGAAGGWTWRAEKERRQARVVIRMVELMETARLRTRHMRYLRVEGRWA